MARPRKNNADYFSHDNDMRNDDKILSVRRKFGHEGYSVWNMLLEKLCKSNGFIIDVDNVSIELLSGDFVVDPEKLKEIIDYFVYIRLLCKEGDRIFSQKLIDRFEGLLSKRQRDIEYRKGKQQDDVVIDVENPQSKVKESKVNNIINNITIDEFDQTLLDFQSMRKTIKKPMTKRAIELLKVKLEKLAPGDQELQIAIMNKSIMNCWAGVFELKDDERIEVIDHIIQEYENQTKMCFEKGRSDDTENKKLTDKRKQLESKYGNEKAMEIRKTIKAKYK